MAHRNFARAMRRKTQWAGFGSASGTAVLPVPVVLAAGTPQIISANAVFAGGLGFLDEEVTLTRTIGRITFSIDEDTAELAGSFALGCVVARSEAISAGVASLPSPEDDPDAEWLYYFQGSVINPMNALRDGPVSGGFHDFDVRGQRIMRQGSSVVWLAESQVASVTVGVNGRYLAKLT